ncbi:MAG: anti-sigma B factor RsbW [Candidatus Pristimantibacillus sp.]
MNEIRLQIPAQADYIDIVRICLYGIASKMSFSYEDIEDMKVAVSEACNNAVLYGSQHPGDNMIDICFEAADNGLTVKVKNNGPSFAYSEAAEKAAPLQAEEVSELPVGGLGIYLMEALMDEVTVHTTDKGTEVLLTKFIAV